jgi:hypothetical protein
MQNGEIIEEGDFEHIRRTQTYNTIQQSIRRARLQSGGQLDEDDDDTKRDPTSADYQPEDETVQGHTVDPPQGGHSLREVTEFIEDNLPQLSLKKRASSRAGTEVMNGTPSLTPRRRASSGRIKLLDHAKPPGPPKDLNLAKNDPNLDLILKEDREIGAVGWKIYRKFFRYNGGYMFIVSVAVVVGLWNLIRLFADLFLIWWCAHWDEDRKYEYLGIYWGSSVFYAAMCAMRAIMLFMRALITSKRIHEDMIKSLLFAPLNNFFDRVPVGRILNRVTKDLSLVDNDFPGILGQTLVVIIGGLTEVGVSIYGATYYITPIIILALVSAHYINRYYMKTYTEIVRLGKSFHFQKFLIHFHFVESITKSPILSLFSESLSGVTTIRAFGKENAFLEHQLNLLNENIKNQITQSGLSRWFSLRLNILSLICLIIPTIGVCLIWKERLSPGFSGLLLAYCFDLDSRLINLLSNLNNFASRLVSFERCLAFTT